jgi:AraC-like DNA-binding protein
MEAMMHPSGDFLSTSELDYEGWRDALRADWGRYNPEAIEPETFAGRARPRSVYGLMAIELGCNAHCVERTQRDVRLDGVDHYFVLFQVSGGSTIIQNDQVVQLAVGDAALVDSARPGTYVSDDTYGQWMSLQLPRRSLVSHLGCPSGGVLGRGGTAAGRLLFDLVRNADAGDAPAFSTAEAYMRLAVYDLLGALFSPSDPMPVSRHADMLFKRVCDLIKDSYTNPAFGPSEVAAEAGISLRSLQKLFTARNSTCSHFIYSLRLDHAARLLHRRKLLGIGQPVSEIAYACGFRDYTYFARKFRQRFGHSPSCQKADPT